MPDSTSRSGVAVGRMHPVMRRRPGAIPTPESESNDDSDSDSGVGIGVGIICISFWWSRNRSQNRGDWNRNRSRNRGDWNRSWNRNHMTIPHIYVHGTIIQEVSPRKLIATKLCHTESETQPCGNGYVCLG